MKTIFFTSIALITAGALASCADAQPSIPVPTAPPPPPPTYEMSPRVKKLPKKIFAHYMACWPAGAGAMAWARSEEYKHFHHDSKNSGYIVGSHLRNWPYVPPNGKMTLEESADLEIRRALHLGIDGFTIDAWAGGAQAKATLDALFKVAEEKDYPFEITITPDPNALGGASPVDVIKEFLAKHGNSPKLARREGKPLIFGYQSIFVALRYVDQFYTDHPEMKGKPPFKSPDVRNTPTGWEYLGKAMQELEQKVGQPLYLEFCMSSFGYGAPSPLSPQQLAEAGGILAKYVGGVGSFTSLPQQHYIGDNVLKNGGEWMFPIGFGQKENLPWESYGPPGTEWFRGGWEQAIKENSTLLQYITWNDYGENSALAPGYETRYALYDLANYYISWWKHGQPPVPDHDKVYLVYHKYPKGAKIYPFKGKFTRKAPPALEVITLLPKAATIRVPGRTEDGQPVEYEAPAGLFVKTLPNDPGPVVAEVVRGGKVTVRLESPEPITDKPFREDNAFTAFSTEEARYWKADFGDDVPMLKYSEYGDEDKDGLPNWFEMYWFGTWLDFSTQTIADPNADPDKDGKTNLQEYEAQTDPTLAPAEEKLAGKLPRAYLVHRSRGELFWAGKVELPLVNGDFEQAGSTPEEAAAWELKNGAVRSREKASGGQWSLKLPASVTDFSSAAQSVGSGVGYLWNSDPLNTYALRPGCAVGYALDIASGTDGVLRSAALTLAGGHERWGMPVAATDSAGFVRRSMAHVLSADRGVRAGDEMGVTRSYRPTGADKTTPLYLDNFSPLTLLRPQLAISSTKPLNLGAVAPSTPATSATLTITNGQAETLPRNAGVKGEVEQIATILYGTAGFAASKAGTNQTIGGRTDSVGAILLGKNANLFEFVSNHVGKTPQELKLIGADDKPGLQGGPQPESEEVVVRFKGAPQAGKYSATLRIVTQAANTGTISMAKSDEPPYGLFYVDIPVRVAVK